MDGEGEGEMHLKQRGLGERARELGADFSCLELPRLRFTTTRLNSVYLHLPSFTPRQ